MHNDLKNIFYFFFLIKIDTSRTTNIIAIIANTPTHPKIATILLPNDMIIPANKTPRVIAHMLVLKSIFKKLAAKVPVQAPVPGRGMPTNINKAKNMPLFPADFFNFSPPFSPYSKHHVKNFPINFLSFPHSRTFLANK